MKRILPALVILSFLAVPIVSLAQAGPTEALKECTLRHDLSTRMGDVLLVKSYLVTDTNHPDNASMICLIDLMSTIGDWIFVILLVLALIFILFGAFQFITGGGDPEKIKSARTKLIYAAVGLAVAFLAKGVIRLVEQFIA